MPTFGGLLSVARSGLLASQAQIATASQNVTNAQTPGYSRQRVTLNPGFPEQLPFGTFGTGVMVAGVVRMREEMIDAGYRRDSQTASFTEERRDALQAVEGVLGEPSDCARQLPGLTRPDEMSDFVPGAHLDEVMTKTYRRTFGEG